MQSGLTQKAGSAAAVSAALDRPTQARNWVLFFAVTLAIITYIDRVCISQAAPAMRRDLGLTAVEMGWAFAAFTWAYALFEIPGGWMGDRWGARKVLMRIVIWWSFFTAATAWVWNLASLLVTRALFGAGVAAAALFALTPLLPLEVALCALGAALGSVYPLMIALAAHSAPEARGTAAGLAAGAGALGGFGVPWLTGAAGDAAGIALGFGSLAVWSAAIAAAAAASRRVG